MTKLLTLCFVLALLSNCSNDGQDPRPINRVVKYEITGSYSGKLTVLYNDNVTGNTILDNVNLPWSLEITYPQNITAIGIGAVSASVVGTSGQNATMRILINGKVERASTAATGSFGEISLPALSYLF